MKLDDPVRLRRMILWVMLGALAFTALLAVVGVMDNTFEESYRTIGSGICAAVAAGLLLAVGKLLDSPRYRKTALFFMAIIIVQFMLALVAFWDPLRMTGIRGFSSEESCDLAAASFIPIGIPLVLFFHVRQIRGGYVSGLMGLSSMAIAYGFFLIGAFSTYPLEENLWETGWATWMFGFASAATAAGAGLDRRHWRWIGMAAAVAALGLGVFNIWRETTWQMTLSILIAVAVLVGHANLLSLCNLKPSQRWLRLVASGLAVFGAISIVDVVNTRVPSNDLLGRLGAASWICALCATVATGILAAFNRRAMPPVVTDDEIQALEINLICPTCQKKQIIALSHGFAETACNHCGMKFSIRATAPRCASCNYLLLMFKGDRCPECGAAVG